MQWFFIALINPLAHAFANHIDKYILSKYMKGISPGVLVLFASLLAILMLPFIFLFHPVIFSISFLKIFILMTNGALLVLALIFYFYALNLDEASVVAPLFQVIPVFGFIFGYLILGETLNIKQIFGALLIIVGGVILVLKISDKKIKINKKLIILMLASSIFYALNGVIFKLIAVNQGFVNSLFWDMSGKALFGILIFIFIKSYRRQFIEVIRINRFSVIAWEFLTEILSLAGEVALVLAVLFAPVVLVQTVGSLQPLFVFIIGIFLTFFFPKISSESVDKKSIFKKIIGIAVITLGIFFFFP